MARESADHRQLVGAWDRLERRARDLIELDELASNDPELQKQVDAERAEISSELRARELDLLTCPYVFTPDEARAMAEAGADVLVPHMGLTTKGTIGAQTAKTLDEAVELVQAMHDAAKEVNPDVLVLCHGGPIAEPEDAAYVLERTRGVVGFFGASSMERLPTEVAMTENMKRFKAIPV